MRRIDSDAAVIIGWRISMYGLNLVSKETRLPAVVESGEFDFVRMLFARARTSSEWDVDE